MPRKLKPYKVSEVRHSNSGRVVEIFLDRETKTFYGVVDGVTVGSATEAECKSLIYKKCEEIATYEWKKIIVARTQSSWRMDDGGSVRLKFSVHEIARKPGGDARRTTTAWIERTEWNMGGTPWILKDYHGETESGAASGVYVLPYSEPVENALKDIQQRIQLLRERLCELLGSDDAVARLVSTAGGLLPAGGEESTQ